MVILAQVAFPHTIRYDRMTSEEKLFLTLHAVSFKMSSNTVQFVLVHNLVDYIQIDFLVYICQLQHIHDFFVSRTQWLRTACLV